MKAYNKSTLREFKSSITRFLSILAIIFLGVAFYVGIRATGPNMVGTAQAFYKESDLMNLRIVSTYGLNEDDVELAKQDSNISDIHLAYSLDQLGSDESSVVKLMSYDSKTSMNSPYLMEGRYPTKSNEILLDAKVSHHYSIGDTYKITLDKDHKEDLKQTEYTIVGFANSPMYIENMTRGYTTIGKGTVDFIVFIPIENFTMDVYTDMYLQFNNMESLKAYTKKFDNTMEANKESIENQFSSRPKDKLNEIKKEPLKKLGEAKLELDDGTNKLNDAMTQLNVGWNDYNSGLSQYQSGYETYLNTLSEAFNTLTSAQNEIDTNQASLDAAQAELDQAKIELDVAKAQLDAAKLEFEAQGIDPSEDVAPLEQALAALQELIDNYDLIEGLAGQVTIEDLENLSTELHDIVNNNPDLSFLNPYLDELDTQLQDPNIINDLNELVAGGKEELIALHAKLSTLIDGIKQYQSGLESYTQGYATWSTSQAQVSDGFAQLAIAKDQLNAGWDSYYTNKADMDAFFLSSMSSLTSAHSKLLSAQSEIDANRLRLEDGYKSYNDGMKDVNQLETPEYFFFGRDFNPGYSEFYENTKRVSSIADVIPIFFFSIAALISLTTMTRMVEEKRSEIGTLKGLGYTNKEISKKFLVYAGLATMIGVVLGVIFGSLVFPTLIYSAYKALYNIDQFVISVQPVYIIQSVIFSFVCTMGSTYAVLRENLKATPATLMVPKAPKMGKKIFLERIPIIWKRLSFSMKVTFRNVFRYKQRMIMTIIGIAGCTALVMVGFGLKDSINDISTKQFGDIWLYDAQITYHDEITKQQQDDFNKTFSSIDVFENEIMAYQTKYDIVGKDKNVSLSIVVPKTTENFSSVTTLKNRKTQEVYELDDSGVILSEKTAKMLNIHKGDSVTLRKNNEEFEVVVQGITENYVQHFMYMSPSYYNEHFNDELVFNTGYVTTNSSDYNQDEISLQLMDTEAISNITFMSTTLDSTNDAMKSIDAVVVILIVSAGLLALIVLYNLSNINVSERIRELSTIKVLGFYDNEVTKYIYRENIILSILGIGVGFGLGFLLHRFVIVAAEVDDIMFSPNIHTLSYVLSAVVTMTFTIIVLVIMHNKLKKINMIDALKSND